MPINNDSQASRHYFWQIFSHEMTLIPLDNIIITENGKNKIKMQKTTQYRTNCLNVICNAVFKLWL